MIKKEGQKAIERKNDPQIMTVDEVARYIRVHRSTIYRLAKNDMIPATKVGNQWRFRRDLIDDWLAEGKGGSFGSRKGR